MNAQAIQSALQRADHVFAKRPEAAQMKKVARARVTDGLRCEFSEDDWNLVADMPAPLGGSGSGPTPGTYARAALSTCLAIGYAMRAAFLGVPIRGIEVELRADSDVRGIFCGQVEAPIYSDLAYVVTIDSDAPEADLLRVLEEADERSPYLQLFKNPQTLRREMRLVRAQAVA